MHTDEFKCTKWLKDNYQDTSYVGQNQQNKLRCKLFITLPGQWSLITISQYNHSSHPMFPTDHYRLMSIFGRKVRWRSEHVYTRITDTCRLT